MEKKYISSARYKKSSSENKKNRRTESISKKLKDFSDVKERVELDTKKVKPTKVKKKANKSKKVTIIMVILIIILALCALRLTLKDENEGFFDIFKTRVSDTAIEKLNIALVDDVDMLDTNNKNVILTELNNYTCGVLLKVTENYEIKYELLQSVEKKSNKEYELKIAEDNKLTASVLKARLNSYKDSSSKYYANCSNIQSIEEIDNKKVKVILKEDMPLFIYNLQLPITFSTLNTGLYNINTSRTGDSKVTYIKKEYVEKSIPNTITVMIAENDDDAIKLFKDGSIDMFFTDSYDIAEKLGKTDIDIRSYANGKCLFLFGNGESENFSKLEIRKAIAYSIDREKIRKEIYLNAGSIIDVPELYSDVKFKYDIYDAQNLLLSSGYSLSNSKFVKDGKTVELTFLVNKNDKTKVKVATYIAEDLEKIGLKVNLKMLSSADLIKQIKLKNYDLVLADVNLNENPDISFISDYINITDESRAKLNDIAASTTIEQTVQNLKELTNIMSKEVVCIGIHADSTYLVTKKGMESFSNIKYMNIFSNILLTK